MSFCSTIYGNLPESGFTYTTTTVSATTGSFDNLSATNASITNLTTTTFNPTNVDCQNLTVTDTGNISTLNSSLIVVDNLSVTNFDITNLQATNANFSTMNASNINAIDSNVSIIRTLQINISEVADPNLASVIRRDANNLYFEGRADPTDPTARFFFYPAEEGPGIIPLIINLSNITATNISGINLSYIDGTIDNLNTSQIDNSGTINTSSVDANLLNATTQLTTPLINTGVINSITSNTSEIVLKRSTGGSSTIDFTGTQTLDIDGGFLTGAGLTSKGITLRAGTNPTPALEVTDGNEVTINDLNCFSIDTDNLTSVNSSLTDTRILNVLNIKDNVATNNDSTIQKTSGNLKLSVDGTQADIDIYTGGLVYIPTELDTTLMTALDANITTANISTLNVSNMNVCIKNANILNASTINCSSLVSDGTIDAFSIQAQSMTAYQDIYTLFVNTSALDTQLINVSNINASDIDANNIDADTITGDISSNLLAGTGISLNTVAGITTISSTGGAVTDPLNISVINLSTLNGLTANLSNMNASNVSAHIVDSDITESTIYTLIDSTPGFGDGFISKTSDKMTIRTGTVGGIIEFGTTFSGNFSVQIANDELNASTLNASSITADTLTGDISSNLLAGTGISLSTTSGVTTISSSTLATSQQYYFQATSNQNSNQFIGPGVIANFNQITYDVPSGNYSTINRNYVIPVAGTYQFFFQAFQNNAVTDAFRLGIYKNGNLVGQTGAYVGNTERCGIILELAVNDYVDVRGLSGSQNVYMGSAHSWFEGYLLQPVNNTVTSSTDLTTNSLDTNNLTINNNLNGETFIRTICACKILANGTNTRAINCSVTRTNVGRYTLNFSNPRNDTGYIVQVSTMEQSSLLDDVIIQVTEGTSTTTSFDYFIHEQDNSTNPGTYRDRNHFVTVFDID